MFLDYLFNFFNVHESWKYNLVIKMLICEHIWEIAKKQPSHFDTESMFHYVQETSRLTVALWLASWQGCRFLSCGPSNLSTFISQRWYLSLQPYKPQMCTWLVSELPRSANYKSVDIVRGKCCTCPTELVHGKVIMRYLFLMLSNFFSSYVTCVLSIFKLKLVFSFVEI